MGTAGADEVLRTRALGEWGAGRGKGAEGKRGEGGRERAAAAAGLGPFPSEAGLAAALLFSGPAVGLARWGGVGERVTEPEETIDDGA